MLGMKSSVGKNFEVLNFKLLQAKMIFDLISVARFVSNLFCLYSFLFSVAYSGLYIFGALDIAPYHSNIFH